MPIRILTADDVRAAITMKEAIEAVRKGFIALSSGQAQVPLRSNVETQDGITLYMPAYVQGESFSTVKVVSVYRGNSRFGLPTILAAVLVTDAETGQPRALMDGSYLTALRTGAASGVATDLLARADSSVLGVIGAGTQARTQIEAVCAVRTIREVRVFSRSGAEKFTSELAERYPNVNFVAAKSASEALRGADVVVAATTSATPVIHAADIAAGTHINGVGSFTPQMQEVAADVVTQARIVVDARNTCLVEAGDLIVPISDGQLSIEQIHAEIGEIAAGLKPGRMSKEEITFFKSVGNAVQDSAVAGQVIPIAEAKNLGTVVNL
jgi:ornithine cyclodeaminase